MIRIEVTPQARVEILDAIKYYDEIDHALGISFEKDIREAFDALGTFWKFEIKYKDIRTYRLNRFPYRLHYRVLESENTLQIAACYHERSKPA